MRGKAFLKVKRLLTNFDGFALSAPQSGILPHNPHPPASGFPPESLGHLGFTGTSIWIDPIRELEVIFLSNHVHPTRDNQAIKAFRPKLHDAIIQEISRSS